MSENQSITINSIKRFLFYGAVGLVVEVTYTGLASLLKGDFSMSGKTFLVMFPIYGLALFLEPVHNALRPYPAWIRGLTYLALIWTAEYGCGYLLQNLLGTCPWRYRDVLNIDGLITLKMAPEWFFAGLGFEYLHNFLCPHNTRPVPSALESDNDMQNSSLQEQSIMQKELPNP